MMTILAFLLRLPMSIKVAGVALVVLGVVQVRHRIEVNGLNDQITTLMGEVVAEKGARTDLILALSEVQSNRDALAAEVRRQNEAIAAVTVRAERAEALATVRATRLLQEGKLLAQALRRDLGPVRVPSGHEGMNAWMDERFR